MTGEREVRAKTITFQPNALNVKNVVSADNFGNVANDNLGELLQQIPEVSGVYIGSDPRSVMIRDIDGWKPALALWRNGQTCLRGK